MKPVCRQWLAARVSRKKPTQRTWNLHVKRTQPWFEPAHNPVLTTTPLRSRANLYLFILIRLLITLLLHYSFLLHITPSIWTISWHIPVDVTRLCLSFTFREVTILQSYLFQQDQKDMDDLDCIYMDMQRFQPNLRSLWVVGVWSEHGCFELAVLLALHAIFAGQEKSADSGCNKR